MPDSAANTLWLQRHFATFLTGLIIILGIIQVQRSGLNPRRWDFMLLSSALTFVVGVRLAGRTSQKVSDTLDRLVGRKVLQLGVEELPDLKAGIEAHAAVWGRWGSRAMVLVITIAFLSASTYLLLAWQRGGIGLPTGLIQLVTSGQFLLFLVEALAARIVGHYLGQMVAYGRLGWYLRKKNIGVQVQPGHLDDAGGLRPVGDLYFFQAMLLALLALYLAAWWLAIPLLNLKQYMHWRGPYLWLLVVVLAFEVLAFVAPMWSFHQIMLEQKAKFLTEADALSHKIASVQAERAEARSEQEHTDLKDRLEYMTERYWMLEQVPTWPVDAQMRRRFTINNLALLVPFASKAVEVTGAWQELVQGLRDLLN